MTDKISNSVNFRIDRGRFDKIFPYKDRMFEVVNFYHEYRIDYIRRIV